MVSDCFDFDLNIIVLAMRSAAKTMDDVISWFQKIEAFPRVKDAVYYQV